MTDENRDNLRERLGPNLFRQRIYLQTYHAADAFGSGRTFMHIENIESMHFLLALGLKTTCLYGVGYRNALDINTKHNEVLLNNLPADFNGYAILHLSDLHLDIHPDMCDAMIEKLPDENYDLCVITGDFREKTAGDIEPTISLMSKLVPHIKTPIYAVLGNHDFIEIVPEIEELGVRFLLNENISIEKNGGQIFLAGVDDPHFYETDNFEKAAEGLPQDTAAILLAHTPEVYKKASATGFDFMLCGHTHAGQVCLPGGRAIFKNVHCPRNMIKGTWQFHNMQGYTSPGTGSSGVPVRFFCPPEMTIHTLKSK